MKTLKFAVWPIVYIFKLVGEWLKPFSRAAYKTNGTLFGYPERNTSCPPPKFIDGGKPHHRRGHRGGKKHHNPNFRQTRW